MGVVQVTVENTAAVPISVTSHFHFFEANPRLRFDRAAAYGRHLDVAAGTHVRFPPGDTTTVWLAAIRGERVVVGFAGLVDGPLRTARALGRPRSTEPGPAATSTPGAGGETGPPGARGCVRAGAG